MPTPSAPDPPTLTPAAADRDRFRADWLRLPPVAGCGPVVAAVSGGADSLALLLLLRAELGARCHAATVDHGLRAASAQEAAHVAAICERLGVPHAILRGTLPERVHGSANLSQRARMLRYRLLERHRRAVGGCAIATGHHADDQLETMVMRLNRGSGATGLAGIRAVQGVAIRPLLTWRRHELRRIVEAAGLRPVDDPANRDDRFDRARLRKALAGADWIDPVGATHSARHLAEADAALDWAVERMAADYCVFGTGSATLCAGQMPDEVRRRLVLRCIRHVDPAARPRADTLARTIAALDRAERVTVARVLCDGRAVPHRHCGAAPAWHFRSAPPRRATAPGVRR